MADNVLANLFQDIAGAIREKNGATDTMKPIEFPDKIRAIETGGGSGGGSGGGALDDWNVLAKVWTAPTYTTTTRTDIIASIDELISGGFTLYPSQTTTSEHLMTIVAMARIQPTELSVDTAKRLNFSVNVNWSIHTKTDTTNGQCGFLDYQQSTTSPSLSNQGIPASQKWTLSSGANLGLDNVDGLSYKASSKFNFYPVGSYIVLVLQHKTAKVSDGLT